MSISYRRFKVGRLPGRSTGTLEAGEARKLRNRSRAWKSSLFLVTVVASALLVYGTGPAFVFRVGQRPPRAVLTKVDRFFRRDLQKTQLERRTRAEAVPPLVTNDSAPIGEIQEQLNDLIDAVARVDGLSELPARLVRSWDLTDQIFVEIQAAAASPERRQQLHSQVNLAFEPLKLHGVLGPDPVPADEELQSRLRIRQGNESPELARVVERDLVVPERLARPDGVVAQRFISEFGNPALGETLFALVTKKVSTTPTLRYEEQITKQERDEASNSVPDAYTEYRRGDMLVGQGELIDESTLSLLHLEHQAYLAGLPLGDRIRRGLSLLGVVAGVLGLLWYSLAKSDAKLMHSDTRLTVLCGLFILSLALARLLTVHANEADLIPLALAGMILALAYSPEVSLKVTFCLALLISLALGSRLDHFVILFGGTAAAVLSLRDVRTRTKPIQVGFLAAVCYFILSWTVGMFQNESVSVVAREAFWRAGWGMMTGFLLGGLLPFIERGFGIITGISLLELGDVNHPLLQELVQRAPGTHNHSVTVGTIAEAAADRIGCNGLLVRIGAYFHDVGKMLKPHYFIENQLGGVNRHNALNPAMSTLIIIGHVKDGYELGRQHHLPEPILDLITQHHGTTLVEYFYREATRRSCDDPDSSSVEECSFRYPGPRPQSKEAAILMVSDAVESASRTLSEPTPARIEGLVADIVRKRMEDGQFDECGLTLKEIAEIQGSLVKSLIGIYHGRVKYPEQRTA